MQLSQIPWRESGELLNAEHTASVMGHKWTDNTVLQRAKMGQSLTSYYHAEGF